MASRLLSQHCAKKCKYSVSELTVFTLQNLTSGLSEGPAFAKLQCAYFFA